MIVTVERGRGGAEARPVAEAVQCVAVQGVLERSANTVADRVVGRVLVGRAILLANKELELRRAFRFPHVCHHQAHVPHRREDLAKALRWDVLVAQDLHAKWRPEVHLVPAAQNK